MHKSVLAIAAHPDDIEFVMAGTLMQLASAGWEIHYFNIANGCCGTAELSREACAAVRLEEARRAAKLLSASFYPPIRDDLKIFYDHPTHAEVAAVVRTAKPSIILTHSPVDYMEDHQNTARLAVGAAFVRGMPNFDCSPNVVCFDQDVAVYHAQPHGNCDPLGHRVYPTHVVDVTSLLDRKRELLACHESQDLWLDTSQRMSNYLQSMQDMNHEVGGMTPNFKFAEGWRKHVHLGLSGAGFDPLKDALDSVLPNSLYMLER